MNKVYHKNVDYSQANIQMICPEEESYVAAK